MQPTRADQKPFDIIGDIHGQADKLEALLRKLGYHHTAGAWRHPDRQAIFVGDFIDRGPAQVRSVDTVRRMVDAGAALAIMGNHELNAIAWHTPDPNSPGEYLRPHNSPKWGLKNRQQHAAFLSEVEHQAALHAELINWFLTLPLWIDMPAFRVVHACWHASHLAWLRPRLHLERYLTSDLMVAATEEPSDEVEKDDATPSIFKAVECLTKGIEVPLPRGHTFEDSYGHVRSRVRVRWWDDSATTYRAAAMMSPAEASALPEVPLPEHARLPRNEKPVFFGHYWLSGDVVLQSTHAACVDYSAGKGGPLVAYRFDGRARTFRGKVAVGGLNTSSEVSLRERLRGCLLGGAIGDALGAPVELMSWADIQRTFGPEGICDYAESYGGRGAITDDTPGSPYPAPQGPNDRGEISSSILG